MGGLGGGNSTVATFWPTVGTVLRLGCEGVYAALICSRRVVLPALSRPRRRTEYSRLGVSWGLGERDAWWGRSGTFFAGGVQIYRFEEVVHCEGVRRGGVPRVLHMLVMVEGSWRYDPPMRAERGLSIKTRSTRAPNYLFLACIRAVNDKVTDCAREEHFRVA
jgi:hypothetical protein